MVAVEVGLAHGLVVHGETMTRATVVPPQGPMEQVGSLAVEMEEAVTKTLEELEEMEAFQAAVVVAFVVVVQVLEEVAMEETARSGFGCIR